MAREYAVRQVFTTTKTKVTRFNQSSKLWIATMAERTNAKQRIIPFRVCETITSFLFGNETAGNHSDRSVKLVNFLSPLNQLLLTTKNVYTTIACFVIAKCAPSEIVNFLGATSHGSTSRSDLFVHLMTHGLNSYCRTIWLAMRNSSRYWSHLQNFEFVATEFKIIEKEKQLVLELDAQSYAAAHAMRLRVSELLLPDVLPVHAQEKHIRNIMRVKSLEVQALMKQFVDLNVINITEEEAPGIETTARPHPFLLSSSSAVTVTTPLPSRDDVADMGERLKKLNAELEHWMGWRRQYGNHIVFGNVCLSVQCFTDHCCMSARKRNVDTRDQGDSSDGGINESGRASRDNSSSHSDQSSCSAGSDTRATEHSSSNTNQRAWQRLTRFKRPCIIDTRGLNLDEASNGLALHVSMSSTRTSSQRNAVNENKLYKLPDVLLSLILKYISSYNNMESLNALASCSKHLSETVNKLWLGPVLKHSRISAELKTLSTSRIHYRAKMNMLWQAPSQPNYDSYSDLLHHVFQAYTMYGNLHLQIAQAVVQYSPGEKQELLHTFVTNAKKVQQLTSCELKQKKSLFKLLKLLDFRLLDMFAMDVLNLHEEAIHELPPRAFYQGSKHQKNYRREFTEPDAYTTHRGAKLLHSLQTLRDDLREQRRIMFQTLRAVEAYEVAHIQRLVDELRDTGLVKIDIMHPCGALSASRNTLLSYEQLQDFCNHMFRHAEVNFVRTDKYEFVTLVVYQLRKEISMKLENLVSSLFYQMQSCCFDTPSVVSSAVTADQLEASPVSTKAFNALPRKLVTPTMRVQQTVSCQPPNNALPCTFENWRMYMSRLLQVSRKGQLQPGGQRGFGARSEQSPSKKQVISIRIATAVNENGDPVDGFLLCYQKSGDFGERTGDTARSPAVAATDTDTQSNKSRTGNVDGDALDRSAPRESVAGGLKRRYTVSDFIDQNCLAVHALTTSKDNVKKWPAVNTIKNADVLIVWPSVEKPRRPRFSRAECHERGVVPRLIETGAPDALSGIDITTPDRTSNVALLQTPHLPEVASEETGTRPISGLASVPDRRAFVVVKNTSMETLALLNTFFATEVDVIGTLKNHATLTGKCAPCGRSLKEKNTWIGTTCVGHLPESWDQNRCTSKETLN